MTPEMTRQQSHDASSCTLSILFPDITIGQLEISDRVDAESTHTEHRIVTSDVVWSPRTTRIRHELNIYELAGTPNVPNAIRENRNIPSGRMDTAVTTSTVVTHQGEFEVRYQDLKTSWHWNLVQRIPFHLKETVEATESDRCKVVAHP